MVWSFCKISSVARHAAGVSRPAACKRILQKLRVRRHRTGSRRLLTYRRCFGDMRAHLLRIGFGHELAMLGLAVELIILVVDLGRRVHPDHAF